MGQMSAMVDFDRADAGSPGSGRCRWRGEGKCLPPRARQQCTRVEREFLSAPAANRRAEGERGEKRGVYRGADGGYSKKTIAGGGGGAAQAGTGRRTDGRTDGRPCYTINLSLARLQRRARAARRRDIDVFDRDSTRLGGRACCSPSPPTPRARTASASRPPGRHVVRPRVLYCIMLASHNSSDV